MFLKRILIAVAAFAVVGVAPLTLAPSIAAAAPSDNRGTITASGGNTAAITGLINLQASASNGILLVKDAAGGAVVRTDGAMGRTKLGGFTVYTGVHTVTVTGNNVAVLLISPHLDLHVTGRGRAQFRGTGTYESSSGRGVWSARGVSVNLGPAAPR